VSARVRYLVETPEVIWGCLEEGGPPGRLAAAARRLRRAHVVRAGLKAGFPPHLLAQFPLLAHQWPIVAKFKCGRAGMRPRAPAGGGMWGSVGLVSWP
jgi:conserved oligomeric Golgi complex subunit 1